ncbi:hypothetical protein RJ55_07750 [Drechmeria coniospora]|nr:hypothetical protein RJ55_07750 [Drechmeria coniospora]
MAAKPFVLRAAFGSDNFFRDAYKYDLDHIYEWMDKVCNKDDPTGGPASQDDKTLALLQDVCRQLKALSLPSGTKFKDPKLAPNSHFLRSFFKKPWDNEKGSPTSLFDVVKWPVTFRGPAYWEKLLPWWNPYDLLGLFLALLGPTDQGADKNNFFLPLTAVYGRWCARIAGRVPGDTSSGAGDWPYMFQCTWHEERYIPTGGVWYFLGASTAGDEWDENTVGLWRSRVQLQRFDMLYNGMDIKVLEPSDFRKHASIEQKTAAGSNNQGGRRNNDMYGLALQRKYMTMENAPEEYQDYSTGVIWRNLVGPCANCAHLIQGVGLNGANFAKNLGKGEAPKKPKPPKGPSEMV